MKVFLQFSEKSQKIVKKRQKSSKRGFTKYRANRAGLYIFGHFFPYLSKEVGVILCPVSKWLFGLYTKSAFFHVF